ncbi:MAG: hypothetical protein IJL70_05185, partial [Treponema sp.]|nr:hypothetical protein [Treponema sp.]
VDEAGKKERQFFSEKTKKNNGREENALQKHSVVLPRERQTVWFQGTTACSPLAGGFGRDFSTDSYFFNCFLRCSSFSFYSFLKKCVILIAGKLEF